MPTMLGNVGSEGVVRDSINAMQSEVAHVEAAHGFWPPELDGDPTEMLQVSRQELRRLRICEKILLVHCELSEAVEVLRKNPTERSEKLPTHSHVAEEFADAAIRLFGVAKRMGINNLGDTIVDKSIYNEGRPFMHGKKF